LLLNRSFDVEQDEEQEKAKTIYLSEMKEQAREAIGLGFELMLFWFIDDMTFSI